MAENTEKLVFELAVPERLVFSDDVEMVVVPGADGDFGVLPGHMLLMSSVRPGVVETYADGKVAKRIFVADGFAEVTAERCTVLSSEAAFVDELDRTKAEERRSAAEMDLKDADTDEERARAEAEIAKADAMLAALGERTGA